MLDGACLWLSLRPGGFGGELRRDMNTVVGECVFTGCWHVGTSTGRVDLFITCQFDESHQVLLNLRFCWWSMVSIEGLMWLWGHEGMIGTRMSPFCATSAFFCQSFCGGGQLQGIKL